MEPQRFDRFARLLGRATARRRLLAGLALSPLAGLVAAGSSLDAEAKKRRKKKRRKKRNPETPEPNAFGCLDVGQPCNGESATCCSGICEGTAPRKGKRDSSRCVGHDADICTPGSNACLFEGVLSCGPSNADCTCLRTTGDAPFCGVTGDLGDLELLCRDCRQDTDCHEAFGPAAACVDLREGLCEFVCRNTRTACVPACADGTL